MLAPQLVNSQKNRTRIAAARGEVRARFCTRIRLAGVAKGAYFAEDFPCSPGVVARNAAPDPFRRRGSDVASSAL